MAFTEKGKASRKTRLLRHGIFDWRHAVFGPHPSEKAVPLSKDDKAKGKSRIELHSYLDHYQKIVEEIRKENNKKPYENWAAKSYRRWTTDEMSDHLPIWMELEIDYSEDYLSQFVIH